MHVLHLTRRILTRGPAENLVVKKMTLFATVFTRADGTETYYFNSQLFSKFMYVCDHLLRNVSFSSFFLQYEHEAQRSTPILLRVFVPNLAPQKQFENLTMQVAWKTPLEKLDALEKCINEWLATEENRWFQPNTSITLQHIDYQKYLEITIGIGHNAYAFSISRFICRLLSFFFFVP